MWYRLARVAAGTIVFGVIALALIGAGYGFGHYQASHAAEQNLDVNIKQQQALRHAETLQRFALKAQVEVYEKLLKEHGIALPTIANVTASPAIEEVGMATGVDKK